MEQPFNKGRGGGVWKIGGGIIFGQWKGVFEFF